MALHELVEHDHGLGHIHERINGDACGLARRWGLDPTLAEMLVELAAISGETFSRERFRWPGLVIISGYRSQREQTRVNPFSKSSHHRCCPSLAADLRVGDLPADDLPFSIWKEIGFTWELLGGKWGGAVGEFSADVDPNHFYLGGLRHPRCI